MATLTVRSGVHATPEIIESASWPAFDVPDLPVADERFVSAAGHAARRLPALVHDALVDFADAAPQSGALVLRGVPVGTLPDTPDSPTAPADKDMVSEFSLMV